MFLRKETRVRETGSYTMIPYCKDCSSEDVEIIKTCRKCGSQNIGHPTFNDLMSDDRRGMKPNTMEYEVSVYKCDNCGNEFDGLRTPNTISFSEYGEFFAGVGEEDVCKIFHLEHDYCRDCTNNIIDKLNWQINQLATQENIEETISKLFTKEDR